MASNRSSSNRARHNGTSMSRCGKCCYYCRQVATFLFSHIGLCTLLLGYALGGAFLFQWLESEHEQQMPKNIFQLRESMIDELFTKTNHSPVLKKDEWLKSAKEILDKFEQAFLKAVKYKGYNGNDNLTPTNSQWSFSGALLYSIIVFTTIGYGNVAPRTDLGKIITILYAIIGIPLMLFCLSNIGHAMARSFKFIYWRCCCFLCVKPRKMQRRERRRRWLIRQQRQRALLEYSLANAKEAEERERQEHWQKALAVHQQQPQSQNSQNMNLPVTETLNSMALSPSLKSNGLIRSSPTPSPNPPDGFNVVAEETSESSTSYYELKDPPRPAVSPSAQASVDADKKRKRKTNVVTRKMSQIFSHSKSSTNSNNINIALKSEPSTPTSKSPNLEASRLQVPGNEVRGSNVSLSRSMSARYHSELRPWTHQHHHYHNPLNNCYITIPNGSSIIANKYASFSDDCIDLRLGETFPLTKATTATTEPSSDVTPVKPTIAPATKVKRQPSQVRFQAPNDIDLNQIPDRTPPTANISQASNNSLVLRIPTSTFLPGQNLSSAPLTNSANSGSNFLFPPGAPQYPFPSPPPATAAAALPPLVFPMFNCNNSDQTEIGKNDPILLNYLTNNNSNTSLKNNDLLEFLLAANERSLFNSDDEDENDENITEKNIPITVCLSVVFGYICAGALFFSASEEWSFLDAFYFCFITLSTIGFGDLVPGRTVLATTPEEGQMTLAICALYLLFGMALLAMSLNLVKEKVQETVRIIGQRIGILVADEDDDDFY